MGRTCVGWGLLGWLSCLSTASAAPAQEAKEPRDYAAEAVLSGSIARSFSAEEEDGVLFGGTALLRSSVFEAGAGVDMGGALFDTTVFNASLLAGFGLQLDSGPRLDLLGSLGMDFYHASGGFLDDDPGSSASLGCAGGRAVVSYRFPARHTGHFMIGAFVSYERNFRRVTVQYSYTDSDWLFGGSTVRKGEHTFGDQRIALALNVGLTFDLMPQ